MFVDLGGAKTMSFAFKTERSKKKNCRNLLMKEKERWTCIYK